MTDRVRSTGSLLESVRALALARAKRVGMPDAAITSRQDATPPIRPHDRAALRRQLRALVAQVDPHAPDVASRLRPPIIREILLWEFGAAFRSHPDFLDMVDAVDQAIAADPQLQGRLGALIQVLRAEP